MAEKTDVEIIRIDTKEAVTNLSELKDYIKDLKAVMNEAKIGSDEFKQAQNELDKVVVQQKQIMNGAANEFKAAEGSFNDLNNQLRGLKEAWKATGDEMKRNELGKQINDVKAKINEMNHSIGNFQDQVGNYNGMLSPLFDSLGQKIDGLEGKIGGISNMLGAMGISANGVIKPMTALNTALKLIARNPVMFVLSSLIGLFMLIKDAVSANEDLQRRWNKAMAAFEPIVNAVKNALDTLANGLVWVAEKVGKFISLFSDASKVTTGLAEAQDKLNMAQREFKGNENALRAEAKQLKLLGKETNDYEKKLKYYQESRAKLRAVNQRAVDLAKEELRIAEEQAKLAPNSQADNEKIAALKQKVGQAQEKLNQEDTEYVELINSANTGLKKLNTTTGTATDKTKELTSAVERMEQTIADSSKSQVQKLEDEKRKWVDIYKQLKKNTKALEEYYDKKIASEKASERAKSDKVSMDGKIEYANLYSELLAAKGNNLEGNKLVEEWIDKLAKISNTDPQLIDKMNLIGNIYKEKIFSAAFPTKKELDDKVTETVQGFIDSFNNATTQLDVETMKMNVQSILLGLSNYGDIPFTPDESFDAYINEAKTKLFAYMEEVAAKGNPITEADQQRISDLTTEIQLLLAQKDLYDKLTASLNILNKKSESISKNADILKFFGTKTDSNGFATDGEKLGKALRNVTKVWEDYGSAVSTVLDTIGDAWQKNLERQVKAGRMTEDEAKKQFKMIQAMQYSLSVVNAAASTVAIWADPSMGVYQKIATTISVAAQNAAELITIATTQFGDMSGSVDAGGSNLMPAVINDTNPVSYTRNLTTAEERDEINNQQIWVSVSEISEAENKRKVKVAESRF